MKNNIYIYIYIYIYLYGKKQTKFVKEKKNKQTNKLNSKEKDANLISETV